MHLSHDSSTNTQGARALDAPHGGAAVLLGAGSVRDGLETILDAHEHDGPLVLISAGWQEWEGTARAGVDHLRHEIVDIGLHARAHRLLDDDPALAATLRERSRRIVGLQVDYGTRLGPAVDTIRTLDRGASRRGGNNSQRHYHYRDALGSLRALDRAHQRLLASVHAEPLPASDALDQARGELADTLKHSSTVLLAGGHVAVLRNRLRLLGLDALLGSRRLIAWGAGAMVCTERVVLVLDRSPRGQRAPELMDSGLGVAPRVVIVPNARTRLALDDDAMLSVHARRFAPSRCISLDDNAIVAFRDRAMVAATASFMVLSSGKTRRLRAA